jgi:hypothetical protein
MAIRGGIEADTWDSLSASQRDMAATHFEGANLSRARLEGSSLRFAHLEGADLRLAHLDGVTLRGAHLAGADLRGAYCDRVTVLTGVDFGDDQRGSVKVDNAHWGQANMSVVDWTRLGMLGDEQLARTRRMPDGKLKSRALRIEELEAAVRANRQLAAALDAQGVSTAADHFAYRAQFLQQQVLRRRRKFGAYFFSRILDGLAGYGYKPIRGLIAYILVIVGFAFAYGLATHGVLTFGLPRSQIQPLQWYEALVLSISSFHGRGFFQPVQSLGDPVAIIAAVEAIIGLVIEVSFIATFTQRFFGK